MKKIKLVLILSALSCTSNVMAAEKKSDEQLKDMSDPLAIYTQAAIGFTDKGFNFKVGQTYETGDPVTGAMNIVEIKGVAGDLAGWSGSQRRDNSIDSFRIRNLTANIENGRGAQLDIDYNVEQESMNASYSFLQALPAMGIFNLYPLAGVGLNLRNGDVGMQGETTANTSGYNISGTYFLVGTYSKLAITDKIWINYNPMWLTTLSGSDNYVDNAYGSGYSNVLLHELVLSYQITPRFNVRYFGNWTNHQNYFDGDQRVEFNYQF
ncbi:hypothetical protein PCNPT3_09475 [Psychromonas sp. CNPT3]|uniref:hypothetical protein n=1 Tax=Psychromonas sp. CNPT3 TaxID=314282 RepID=UPI00006E9165|nr:hypothetical protein [Psychromonas sp. CNPT3]AGH81833.1 hypothetical protein PCNPT3_09475 [Psychromonas sp. CNPT3]